MIYYNLNVPLRDLVTQAGEATWRSKNARVIWYWRKTIEGVPFGKSTKTSDKRGAEKNAAIWEAEAVRELILKRTKHAACSYQCVS